MEHAPAPLLFGHQQEGRAGGHMEAFKDSIREDLDAGRGWKGRPAHTAQPVHEQLSCGPRLSCDTYLDV